MVENLLSTIENLINNYSFLGPIAAFMGGVLVSLSPCIYPLIPITLSIIGASAISSRRRGFILSFVFVLGIATTYTILGVIFSFMGLFLGTLYSNPFLHLFLGIVLIVLALAILGVIRLPLLNLSTTYKPQRGALSVYLLGMASGLGVSPCLLPVLGAILGLISLKQNVVYGAVTLFFFSLGYGSLLIILGTFTSLICRLPKSGKWLIIIHKSLGGILLITAGYFIINFFRLL